MAGSYDSLAGLPYTESQGDGDDEEPVQKAPALTCDLISGCLTNHMVQASTWLWSCLISG